MVLPFLTLATHAFGKITNLVVAFAPDMRGASFHDVAGLHHNSSTTGLSLIMILIKGSRSSLRAL